MRKITNFKLISMEFPSSNGVFNVTPFETLVKTYLTSVADYGWELDGPVTSSIVAYNVEEDVPPPNPPPVPPVPPKTTFKAFFIKTMTVSLTQYRQLGGFQR